MEGFLTTIVIHTAHDPGAKEIENMLDALIACGERQGVDPLRAKAVALGTDGSAYRCPDLVSSRTVNDGVMQGKWERR